MEILGVINRLDSVFLRDSGSGYGTLKAHGVDPEL